MKTDKGRAGYLRRRRKQLLLKLSMEAFVIAGLMILGIMETGSRSNLLTVVAILGCLPAGKAFVELIMVFPHKSLDAAIAEEVEEKAEGLTTVYDLVFTSTHKIMPVDCMVIMGHTICGYSSNPKTDLAYTAKHLKEMLEQNKYTQMTVKIFDQYQPFLLRVEGMHNIAVVEGETGRKREEAIRSLLMNLSL